MTPGRGTRHRWYQLVQPGTEDGLFAAAIRCPRSPRRPPGGKIARGCVAGGHGATNWGYSPTTSSAMSISEAGRPARLVRWHMKKLGKPGRGRHSAWWAAPRIGPASAAGPGHAGRRMKRSAGSRWRGSASSGGKCHPSSAPPWLDAPIRLVSAVDCGCIPCTMRQPPQIDQPLQVRRAIVRAQQPSAQGRGIDASRCWRHSSLGWPSARLSMSVT